MAAQRGRPARSLYRQARLTFTQETSGACSFSLYAKPLNAEWNEHQCIVRASVDLERPIESTEDVIAALMVILDSLLLPKR